MNNYKNLLRTLLESPIELKLSDDVISSYTSSKYADDGNAILKWAGYFTSMFLNGKSIEVNYHVTYVTMLRTQYLSSSGGYPASMKFEMDEIFGEAKNPSKSRLLGKVRRLLESNALELKLDNLETEINSIRLERDKIAIYLQSNEKLVFSFDEIFS